MKKNRTHARASDMAQISVSLPRELLKKIDDAASRDRRPRSNWLQLQLSVALEADNKSTAGKLRVITQDQEHAG